MSRLQDDLEAEGKLKVPSGLRIAQEGMVMMTFSASHVMRMPLIREYQQGLLAQRCA
jgi:hypothetical protein